MSGWQPIETVRIGKSVAVWLECLSGEGFAMVGQVFTDDPVIAIRERDGGEYWPHENGAYATHWISAPTDRDIATDADREASR